MKKLFIFSIFAVIFGISCNIRTYAQQTTSKKAENATRKATAKSIKETENGLKKSWKFSKKTTGKAWRGTKNTTKKAVKIIS